MKIKIDTDSFQKEYKIEGETPKEKINSLQTALKNIIIEANKYWIDKDKTFTEFIQSELNDGIVASK